METSTKLVIAGSVLAIVLIVLWLYYSSVEPTSSGWTRTDGKSFILGKPGFHADIRGNNTKYLGDADRQIDCENYCSQQGWCKAYTWFGPDSQDLPRQCFGMEKKWTDTDWPGAYSGEVSPQGATESFDVGAVAAEYSNTMQRRFGMASAGRK